MNFKYYKPGALIPFILILAIIYNIISSKIESLIPDNGELKQLISYIDIFSTISLLTLTFTFLNFIGWKWKIFKWLIDLPNLNGRYTGYLISTFQTNGVNTIKDCAIEIRQTASKIKILSYYGDPGATHQTSSSYSISEEIFKEDDDFFSVYHIYSAEPNVLQPQLNIHAGSSYMKFHPAKKQLIGNYYNDRPNKGTIEVTFKQKQLIAKLRD